MENSRHVLVIGGNRFPFHRFEVHGSLIADMIPDAFDVTLTTEKESLTDLSEYDAVVDYLTDSTFTDAQQRGLLTFVEEGGGYLGLHCAADLTSIVSDDPDSHITHRDEPFSALRELVGGHFRTHPEQTTFDVRIVDHFHPVTANLSDLRVYDEPYVLDVDDDVRVLARMDHPDHADMPVVWTHNYEEGKVFYCSLGHDEASLTNGDVRSLIANAIRWLTRA
ncbi:hypothetical protein SAMN04487950_3761 [Halogranum rubrum]|uniref:ThuA-like domain-containing protein n=1 Tax=Halogranum rubrum TaxID=553466 RepID=A0A1I4HQV8_9EURY|nr:ThuA domain-containing protein [Halogranum rubrum]SFL44143.1 hypothetical protein SAMN04487950_3761 [Halogranum rubrum]